MARYRGRHRAPSTTGRTLARTAVAGAVLTAPAVAAPVASVASADTVTTWDRLAQCESSGNWGTNTGNGFEGGLQFTPGTWHAFGGGGRPMNATREEQISVAERVLSKQGWAAWPACSRKLGLRGTAAPVHVAPQAKPSTTEIPALQAAPAPSAGAGGTVTVAVGDTLSRIASAHDVPGGWQALRAANPGLRNANILNVGLVLRMPS